MSNPYLRTFFVLLKFLRFLFLIFIFSFTNDNLVHNDLPQPGQRFSFRESAVLFCSELAKCVAGGIRKGITELSVYLVSDFKKFDPAHPNPVDRFFWTPCPGADHVKPAGN